MMDQVDQAVDLEKTCRRQSMAIRIGLAVLITYSTLKGCVVITYLGRFYEEVFRDVMTSNPMPRMAPFFIATRELVVPGLVVLAMVSIAVLFAFRRNTWSMAAGVVAAVVTTGVVEVATYALVMPLISITYGVLM